MKPTKNLLKYVASIHFDTTNEHPDAKNVKGQVYNDVYTVDPDYFYGHESIMDYIATDLKLVAGGGYNWDHITNVKISIRRA